MCNVPYKKGKKLNILCPAAHIKNISCGIDWKEVLHNDIKKQYEVAQIVFERQNQREDIISAL